MRSHRRDIESNKLTENGKRVDNDVIIDNNNIININNNNNNFSSMRLWSFRYKIMISFSLKGNKMQKS